MSIFATGVTGTIGKHLSNKVNQNSLDLRKPEELLTLPKFSQSDSFLHIAGIVGTQIIERDISKAFEVSLPATLRLAKKSLVNGGGRFIFISSSHVYSPSVSILN